MNTEKHSNYIIVSTVEQKNSNTVLSNFLIKKSASHKNYFNNNFLVEGEVIAVTKTHEEAVQLINQLIAEHNVEVSR